jgi:phytoene desaturase
MVFSGGTTWGRRRPAAVEEGDLAAKRVIIVGAGPGGLAAGMMLAHKGYDVRVFEKQEYVGGRNSSFRLGEYVFDLGPTFFMMTDVLERIFDFTGRQLSDYVETTELDPMYRLKFSGGRELYLSRDRDKMRETLEAFAPGSFEGYEKYLKKEKKKYDKLIPCLAMPYGSVWDFFTWQFMSSLPVLDAHVSLYDVLSRYFDDPDVRISFTFQAKYIGMSPWSAPGTFSIISYIEHGGGIFHVRGGLNQLSKAMCKALEECGGTVRTETPIREVMVENRTAVGVTLEDGTEERADRLVMNADFGHAMTHLVDPSHRKKYTDTALENKKYSCSTFMLYLGVGRQYPDIPHHSIIFAEDYKRNVDEITTTRILPDDPSFYVQNASVTDPTLAPEGKSTIYVLVPVPNNKSGIDWDRERGPFRDKMIDLLERQGGYEDLRDSIEEEKVITPSDWESERDVYKGATFNLAHNVGQMLLFRPHNRFEEFRNCYLVGGGTHPGSGLPTIYESGRISAELIMQEDGLL